MLARKDISNKTLNGVKPYAGLDQDHRAFLDWHRTLGPSFPACDLDCILVEYDYGRPCGLCEMKSWRWKYTIESYNTKAVSWLGTMASIPAFLVKADQSLLMFDVWPINDLAKAYVEVHNIMCRKSYANFLEQLRTTKRCK